MAEREHGIAHAFSSVMHTPIAPGRDARREIGWWILFLFAVQIVTGTLLSFYYEASPDVAAESVRYIMRDVRTGWLMRGLHTWCSHGMIALGVLQLLVVLFARRYRGSGEASWLIGLALFVLVCAFAFSGGLLPWDGVAHGAAINGVELLASVPVVGGWLAEMLRGGDQVASATLSRAYSAHVLLLPWLMFFLVLVNLWYLGRRGSRRGGAR